ncbi:MAG: hypothetical protein VKK62_08545 [Synechococcaceae cyanobacterium]|nr:hypothetical protein [Synechococcaceae cyanobacterium]
MPPLHPAVPRAAGQYRLPQLLQDIRLLDLLELSGSTLEASRASGVSQPTISRRTRALAADFALVRRDRRRDDGCYAGSEVMRLLRLGCRAHRLSAGVARLGADVLLQPLLVGGAWLLPAPTRFRRVEDWCALVQQGVLDGALVSGLELELSAPARLADVELCPLGSVPLGLALDPDLTGASVSAGWPAVLMPGRGVAVALQQALAACGLELRTAGPTCQSPAQWTRRLSGSGLAMPLPELDPAGWWQRLQRRALPRPLLLPIWLVLPKHGSREPLLAFTAERLAAHPNLVRPQGG